MQEDVFASKLVREKLRIAYQFCCADEKKTSLQLRTTASYMLRNKSNKDINYTLRHYYHSYFHNADQRDGFTNIDILCPLRPSRNVSIERDAFVDCSFGKEQSATENGIKRRFCVGTIGNSNGKEGLIRVIRYLDGIAQEIQAVSPLVIPADHAIEIKYAYEQSMRFEDKVSYITTHPAKSLVTEALLCDPTVAELQLEADSAHRLDPVKVSLNDKNVRSVRWEIPGPLLPGQGIELYWYRKSALPSAKKGQAVENEQRKDDK